jgi:hypothetical protein
LIDQINEQLCLERRTKERSSLRLPAAWRCETDFSIGEGASVALLAELGDPRRFAFYRHALRFAGLDVTVSQSDESRAPASSPH